MKLREHDPRRLDVEHFASEGATLEGQWPLSRMPRLVEACHPEEPPGQEERVAWRAHGERRRVAGESQTWLQLALRVRLELTCQRCLGPVETPLEIDRWFRFVDGETQAAALDAELEDDVLASTRSLDLQQLAEDELLLALPIVPRHDACPQPLRPPAFVSAAEDEATPNPFAALAGLKSGRH